ncbi:Uncharacterized protein QTN25_009293 [Entamoeba marina]
MESFGFWKRSYVVCRRLTEYQIETFKRKVHATIYPNDPQPQLDKFWVKAIRFVKHPSNNYLTLVPGDHMTVLSCKADGTLFCQIDFPDHSIKGYVDSNNVIPCKFREVSEVGGLNGNAVEIVNATSDTEDNSSVYDDNEELETTISSDDDDDNEKILLYKSKHRFDPSFGKEFKHFHHSVLHDVFKTGKDLYTPMFVVELGCLIYLFFFLNNFTGLDGNFKDFIFGNYVPLPFALVLFIQFLNMLVDRIIYLCRSVKAKLVLQFVTVIIYGILFFLYFPILNDKRLSKIPSLVFFYIFKCVYWVLSGIQIRCGYNFLSSGRILQKYYDYISWNIYTLYRSVPFLFEIRCILDWCFAHTSIQFHMYQKQEDIHAECYTVQCQRCSEARRNHRYGERRRPYEKLSTSCYWAIISFVVVWLPMFVMSSAAPIFIVPNLVQTNVVVSLIGYNNIYDQNVISQSRMSKIDENAFSNLRTEYTFLKSEDSDRVSEIHLTESSQAPWLITKPSLSALSSDLENEDELTGIILEATIVRGKSAVGTTFTYKKEVNFDTETKKQLKNMIDYPERSHEPIALNNVFPAWFKLPASSDGDLVLPSDDYNTAYLILQYDSETHFMWFEITMDENPLVKEGSEIPYFFILSSPVADDNLLSRYTSQGIVGLYTGLVVLVSTYVRDGFSGVAHTIMFKCLPQTYDLLRIEQDLILARQERDLVMEEDLNWEMIIVYRNPHLLFELTKKPPIHPPVKKYAFW